MLGDEQGVLFGGGVVGVGGRGLQEDEAGGTDLMCVCVCGWWLGIEIEWGRWMARM